MFEAGTAGRAGQTLHAVQPPPPCNPSCFDAIESAASMASTTAEGVENMVARLAGSVPPTVSPGIAVASDGLLASADGHASSIRASLERIQTAISRLEKSLP